MKKLATLILMSIFYTATAFSQANPDTWDFYVIQKVAGGYKLFPGASVNVNVMYKDTGGFVIYKEKLDGILDDISHITFYIGTGDNPFPPILPDGFYGHLHTICWDATVDDGINNIILTGMEIVSPVPVANEAENAQAIGGNTYTNDLIDPKTFLCGPPNTFFALVEERDLSDTMHYSFIKKIKFFDVFKKDTATNALTGQPTYVVRFNTEFKVPLVISETPPNQIDSRAEICVNDLNEHYNVFAAVNRGHRQLTDHNTAAIYADNQATTLSAGVNAKAATWGLFGTANNGAVGVSNSGGNGAGVWGAPSQAPDAGGYKYAVLGDARSFTGAWAGAFFGSGFYTGTWTMSSDARLKTEIRSQTNALDKIMKLRPANYNYRQDTPYGLPQGLHHGFIAQEVEGVLPELVSDITMPLSLDPQDMHTSGTTSYKGINYIEMISILTGALQELNTTLTAKIDAQAAEIAELKKLVQHK